MGAVLQFTLRRSRSPGGGGGSEPLTPEVIRAEIEHGVQAALDTADRLIGLLDRMDGDADLEDGGDNEPSLGAPEEHTCQVVWLRGGDQDRAVAPLEPAPPDVQAAPDSTLSVALGSRS